MPLPQFLNKTEVHFADAESRRAERIVYALESIANSLRLLLVDSEKIAYGPVGGKRPVSQEDNSTP